MAGLLLVWALLLHQPSAAPDASQRCACAAAREAGGWCGRHEVGWLGGVKIASTLLYEVMDAHGHDVDPATFPCAACQRAIASDGFCQEHRVGFVDGKAYFSLLTHHLAKGEVRRPGAIACRTCRRHARRQGWCDACGVGMLGPIALRCRAEFEEAVLAVGVLREATRVASRCDRCAAAMVTDNRCPSCRIAYRGGKPLP